MTVLAQLYALRRQGCLAGSDLPWTVTNLQQTLAEAAPYRDARAFEREAFFRQEPAHRHKVPAKALGKG